MIKCLITRPDPVASRGLSKDQKNMIHKEISGQNYSYKEIKDLADAMKRGEY